MTDEARITINGHTLNTAQSMTVRVALEAFAHALVTEGLNDQYLTEAYLNRIREIRIPLYQIPPNWDNADLASAGG